ncbi:Ser-Thr-rich glycosyl-phosphatidyl-inositol-anchored membrane family-domain-containing protein [Xylaria telfairii]|nr:Ser-Thr-rich glycosyl-phosphatidyl-inositol-anchored membrane family-domain-containing protein [Xylaria telfairii]
MKVAISSVLLTALLGFVNAKVELTNSNFSGIEAGSTFEITWAGAEGPVTLFLKNGDSNDLKTVQTITTNGAVGTGSFEWAVDPSLPSGNYALEISDGSDINYSKMFPVVGTKEPVSTTGSSSSTVSATSSSASSSSTSSESSSATSTSSESSSSSSTATTSSETSSTSSESSTASHSSTVTRTTSSAPTTTQSNTPQTSVPNSNDARSMAAPLVPGLLALLGAALV